MILAFHPLTIADREAVQAVSLKAGRRNCNYTFANLVGWQFWFHTEVCLWNDAVLLRFNFEGKRAYMICMAGDIPVELLSALYKDSGGNLMIIGLEDSQLPTVYAFNPACRVEARACRDQYDYIYLRTNLASLRGKKLSAKRNHVNHFCAQYPDFEYRPLSPGLFDECRRLTAVWQEEKEESSTIDAEHRVMETVFAHWESLEMTGGSIFVGGRMVAFTYGAAVTTDTFDVCVEKADRHIEGAFAIVNQQFALHLPEQYRYVNREEDMGIEGLRKAKLSYHPEYLLSYNVVQLA